MVMEFFRPEYPLNLFVDNLLYYTDYHPEHTMDRFFARWACKYCYRPN